MKQTTNQALDRYTIESLINRAKTMGYLGESFLTNVIKPELEKLPKEDPDVKALLRTINDYLKTFYTQELQALETRAKAVSAAAE